MTDTRYLYFRTTTGVIFSNDQEVSPRESNYLLGYEFDDLNGALEFSGIKSGQAFNGNIMLNSSHTVSLKLLFDSRSGRSEFANAIVPYIIQFGYSDNTQYGDDQGEVDKRIYWADATITKYSNLENNYINGYEQEVTITITSAWQVITNAFTSGTSIKTPGTKKYQYHYNYRYGEVSLEVPKMQLQPRAKFTSTVPTTTTNIKYGLYKGSDRIEALSITIPNGYNELLEISTDWTINTRTGGIKSLSTLAGNVPLEVIRVLTMPNSQGIYPAVYFEFYDDTGNLLSVTYKRLETQNFI